jgi:diguanylate cyclase (GGDEF)-like protein/PAS domain S-box-containing protein
MKANEIKGRRMKKASTVRSRDHKHKKYFVQAQLEQLKREISEFEAEKAQQEIILRTIIEHGDLITTQLLGQINKLQQQFSIIMQEKNLLQLMLDTVTDTADAFQAELHRSNLSLEAKVARYVSELEAQNQHLQAEIKVRRQAEANLHLAASVFEANHEGIIITNAQEHILQVNKAYTHITGYSKAETLGHTPELLRSGRHDKSFYRNMHEAVSTVGYWSGEVWNRRKSGEIFPCWLSISTVYDTEGNISHYIGILADSSHQKSREERIYYLSHHNALTGLPNRVLFVDRLEQAIRRAEYNHSWLALALIDLDKFKHINEAFGHHIGDDILANAAARIHACLSGEQDMLAHLGGDEFVVLCQDLSPNHNSVTQVAEMVQTIQNCLHQGFKVENDEVLLTASIGISFYPQDGQSAAQLLHNADTAAATAKQERNHYCFYTHSDNREVRRRLCLQQALRHALERNELQLHYQPKVALLEQHMSGVEALLRWHHPEWGALSPAEFIPVAEESGLIIAIGEWALETACRQHLAWCAQGLPHIQIAVNLSARQFYHDDLVLMVENTLRRSGLPPHCLELEITESLAMRKLKKTVHTLEVLKQTGVRLALDDFGTGYSSLSYLQQFPLDTLKIDASFVRNIDHANGTALLASIIHMAHSLKLETVAEGVEYAKQLNILRQFGCDTVQGFWFAPAMPGDEIKAFFHQCTPLFRAQEALLI